MPTSLLPAPVPRPPPRLWRGAILRWPFLLVGSLLLACVALLVSRILAANDGHLVYPIDDTYGHLAVAKNLLHHGTWTYSAPNGFDSGDSSLLWPWVLAASDLVSGVNVWSTLVLNVLSALGLLGYAARVLDRQGRSAWFVFVVLLTAAIVTPLPLLVVIGMEHCFHALVFLVFLDLACRWLARDGTLPERTARRLLPAAALVLTATRFEGLFPVALTCLLLVCRREGRFALLCGGAAAAPVVAFGLFSWSRGWAFLPCSVLLKGTRPISLAPAALLDFAGRGYEQLAANPHMLFLVLALALSLLVRFARRVTLWDYRTLLPFLTLATTILHLQFAALGWFYRYEAYLMAAGTVAVAVALSDSRPAWMNGGWRQPPAWPPLVAAALVALLFLAPAWQRTAESGRLLVQSTHNIYEQQFQMGRFLHRYYEGQGVACNDIGNIAYATDVRLCDLAGLVNMDVMRGLRARTYDQATVRRLLAKYDVRVIVVYDTWAGLYGGQLPEWGVPVGRWTIPDNYVCASETVSFYAPRPELAPALTAALRDFASALPADVAQDGVYRHTPPPHVLGAYYPAFDEEGTYYWSSHYASFYLPPDHALARPLSGSALETAVRPKTPGQTLDILVNGCPVQRRRFTAAETDAWVPLVIRAPWHEGLNVVSFEGQGRTVILPGDNRPLLFGVREPRWTVFPSAL